MGQEYSPPAQRSSVQLPSGELVRVTWQQRVTDERQSGVIESLRVWYFHKASGELRATRRGMQIGAAKLLPVFARALIDACQDALLTGQLSPAAFAQYGIPLELSEATEPQKDNNA